MTTTQPMLTLASALLLTLASGCERQLCGHTLVGGGELGIRIVTEDEQIAFETTLAGEDDLQDGPFDGPVLNLGPNPTDSLYIHADARVPDADNPCDSAKLFARIELEVQRDNQGDVDWSNVWVNLEMGNGSTAFGLDYDQDPTFTFEGQVAGTMSSPTSLRIGADCPGYESGAADLVQATLHLDWRFDPDVQRDEVSLTTGRCNRDPIFY